MRKRITTPIQQNSTDSDREWVNLEELSEVEITSEDAAHPIEGALIPGQSPGWRASAPGKQTIRLLFSRPQPLQRICLGFLESEAERTQEYVLRWSPDDGKSFQEIVRQQWNFHPEGASRETEEHQVDLPAVTVLELTITPDISGGDSVASLQQMRLA